VTVLKRCCRSIVNFRADYQSNRPCRSEGTLRFRKAITAAMSRHDWLARFVAVPALEWAKELGCRVSACPCGMFLGKVILAPWRQLLA